jgi:DNA-binding response OmpR family regulator
MKQIEKQAHILLVEDDINLGFLLLENLRSKGFEVTLKQTGKAALDAIRQQRFDLCIIDIMLPEVDGFTVAESIQKQGLDMPFLFLTARLQEQDKLHGFELGADDYMTKPFSFKELYYRVMVVLRRRQHHTGPVEGVVVEFGQLSLDPSQRMLTVNGKPKKLSHRESGLLEILLEQKGKYVNRSDILKRVWGTDDYFTAKSMDVYITRIRKLLKEIPSLEIENLYGTGYRIREVKTEEHATN